MYCSLIDVYKNYTNTKKRKKQFLFVGQLIKRKNVERLIDVFKSLNLNKEEWKLLLVGNGNLDLKKNRKPFIQEVIEIQDEIKIKIGIGLQQVIEIDDEE